jgi:hypothetical protein
VAAGTLLVPFAANGLLAQVADPGRYNRVDPVTLPLDRPGVWTLNFAYRPIRILPVDVPGRGRMLAWYMVYQVYNRTDTPQRFQPWIELVTKDVPAVFADESQPTVIEQIRKVEDPDNLWNLQTSVGIMREKIPVTKPDSVPRSVYGCAVWLNVAEKAPKTNAFSVYVTGLSNGLARAETEGGAEIVSRKTLQIDFVRPTDDNRHEIGDIRPFDNNGLGAERWIYRTSGIRRPKAEAQ